MKKVIKILSLIIICSFVCSQTTTNVPSDNPSIRAGTDAYSADAEFCDDFDSYTAGDFLCTQSDLWWTWDNNPGGPHDAYVTDAMAQTAPNSIEIDGAVMESDVVCDLGQTRTGSWKISLDIYIPDGGNYGGYFNVMQDMVLFGAVNEWGFQIYFSSDGTGYFYDADYQSTNFTYDIATWINVALVVNLDLAMAQLWFDGFLVGEPWQWDIDGPNMLGAVDIYAAAGGNDIPKFYIDNFCFEEFECEDFDSYTVGDYVAVVVPGWTTFSNNPGSVEDGMITDIQAHSPLNSFLVEDSTDLVNLFGDYNLTTGRWYYSNYMLVPDGFCGYFNLQKDVVPGVELGFQVFFDADGSATCDAGIQGAASWTFTFDEWHFNELIVDIDIDYAEYWFDGELIVCWTWSQGTFGIPGAMTLGGANYYAWSGIGEAMAYFDDICIEPRRGLACENFDNLGVGGGVATQLYTSLGPWYTCQGYLPPGYFADDAVVSDMYSYSSPNSFRVYPYTSLIFTFGFDALTSGSWIYSHYIYVPSGYSGYFSIMSVPFPCVGYNLAMFFDDGGTGSFGYQSTKAFHYAQDTWLLVEINYDLDKGYAWVLLDGEWIETFENTKSIGGANYRGYGSGPKEAYYDDVCFGPGSIHTGIEDPSIEEQISVQIYPNPATDQVTIKSEYIIDEVRIYNNMGHLVYSGQFNNNQMIVNISHLQPGMYIVEVTVEGSKVRRKLIVE